MWPMGFWGRRVGAEVQVLDGEGNVIAITGRNYKIQGSGWQPQGGGGDVFITCGEVIPAGSG